MPGKFDLTFTNSKGEEETPLCIHRAPLGTHERFVGFLLEHFGGDFPLWLAPVQVKIVTVTDDQAEYARQVGDQFREAGIRFELDLRNEKLGYKIRETEVQKIPYTIVIGDKEAQSGVVSPRVRKREKIPPLSAAEFIQHIERERLPGGAP